MHCTTILAAAIFCTFVRSQEYAGSSECGCLEVPATSKRHKDQFCRPHLTIPSERHKHRNCVCRPGLVRNAWGECITKQECTSCKCFRDRDFNVCGRECPVVCNEPISRSCSKSCAFGCDCRPGFVRSSRHRGRCVKAEKCALTCPQFSRFEFCRSTCAPKCGRRPRKTCVTRCTRGDCVCNQGYAEVEHNGETICVPQDQCSRYLQLAPPITPGGNESLGGGISSGGSVFAPGTPSITVHPGVVSGGAAGTPVPGSVGINGSVGGGVSSGVSVSVPSTPSIPVHPGVVTGGAVGPSVPGSVGTLGASPVPNVPTVGTGGVVTIVGGGNQPGSFGTGGVSPIPVVTGGVSAGTPSHGGVVARPPGSTNAQGRPSIGTNGFGSTGGGIFTSSIGPNDSMESGEGSGVDATGIPQHPGASAPEGAPVVTGNIPSNGNSGIGTVAGGLRPGSISPVTIPPGTILPPYTTTTGPVAQVGTGGPSYGTPGFPLSEKPGTNTAGVHSAGTLLTWAGGRSTGLTPSPVQNTPGSAGHTSGVVLTGTPNAATTVSSGVPSPSGSASAGVVIASNGLTNNGGNVPVFSGTNVGSAIPPTVVGGTPPVVVIHAAGGPVTSSIASNVAGGGLPIGSTLPPSTTISGGGATALIPGSGNIGSGGSLAGLPAGVHSAIASTSHTTGTGSALAQPGLVGVGSPVNSGITPSNVVAAPSTVTGTASSYLGRHLVTPSGGAAGVSGSGTSFGVSTIGHGVSVANQPMTAGRQPSSGVPAAAAAATAAAIGSAAVTAIPSIAATIGGSRASGMTTINSAAHHTAPCGPPGSPCLNAARSLTNSRR